MSDDEDEIVSSNLHGHYRQYVPGERVLLFKANRTGSHAYKLSNLAGVHITYQGLTYPSVEHAFQAQKVARDMRHLYSTSGIYGDPTDNFRRGWVAYFEAKAPKSAKHEADAEKKIKKYCSEKNLCGMLSKMVNNLTRQKKESDASWEARTERLGLGRPLVVVGWNFEDAHEDLWLDLLRLKYRDPEMRQALLDTGDAYLIEEQRHEKVKGTDTDLIDFYTAYYRKGGREVVTRWGPRKGDKLYEFDEGGDCRHCNESRCSAIGKFLMKIRDEIRTPKRKASPTRKSPPRSPGSPKSPTRKSPPRSPGSPKTKRVSAGVHASVSSYDPFLTDEEI